MDEPIRRKDRVREYKPEVHQEDEVTRGEFEA
jgi:hypothetical protein